METIILETPFGVITMNKKTLPHILGGTFVLGIFAGTVAAAAALAFILT